MIEIRTRASESWLDHEGGKLVAWKYGRRIWEVVKGRKGLFLTLTYRRDEFSSPLDLYRRQAEEKHVKCFMQKLERRLGRLLDDESFALTGKWVRKMEFQEGGWVHWHIILVDVERIPHAILTEAWGRGHVWVKRLTKKRVLYTCKYVAKAGVALPAWLYGERPRSVRIMQSSPGFWPRAPKPPLPELPAGVYYATAREYRLYGPPPPQRIPGCYRPVGELLRQGRGVTVRDKRQHRCYGIKCEPAELLGRLCESGVKCHGVERGWFRYRCTTEFVDAAAQPLRRGGPSGDAAAPAAALHLRGTGERHGPWFPQEWMAWECEDDAREQWRRETEWPDDAVDQNGRPYKAAPPTRKRKRHAAA